ncbi:putative transcription factor C2C2-GATA family [Helianthus annuus]|uniref:GATA transcription factor n=1 Tax=Helianthus annuus TaxID=4232 RepID=A0A251TUL5_HELAN|nr:GATA transcription factor 8 [Helianthus annuus]XP_021981620.1 GATA transcription factor 8 [Helianthus annuus]KAF5790150.1 putative transcription factor C2C2-GATA family [Helianthus annuus]
MAAQNFTDEIDCGSLFDNFEDLIEFPAVTDTSLESVECYDFADVWTNNSDELQVSDPIFSDSNCASTLSAELAVPYEDIVQLEWLSNFVEDSFSGGGMTMNKEDIPAKEEPLVVANYEFKISSPVSVLESSSSSSSSSSSCSGGENSGKMIPLSSTPLGPQRARSKRPRPPAFNPRASIELISPVTLVPVSVTTDSKNLVDSHSGPKSAGAGSGPDQKKRKKKPKKPEAEFNPDNKSENRNQNQNQNQTGQGVRKCMHCEITKTPQWRAGPMGPKTLCNACGVRHKSGRLFPEYRPAASPTFVPSLHSNSHKKVVEMRTKGMPEQVMAKLPERELELIPNMNPRADYM